MNHLYEQFSPNISHTRINGSFRVLCKPRPIFSRINSPFVHWIETKEFNVTLFFRIPRDKREEGALATLKAEGKEWATKIVKVGGKKISSETLFSSKSIEYRVPYRSLIKCGVQQS